MITVEVSKNTITAKLAELPQRVKSELSSAVTAQKLILFNLVRQKLSGPVLNIRSGDLRSSIFSMQTETATSVSAEIKSSSQVKYGRIHEYGGTTPAHEILPKTASVLAFSIGGTMIFARKVNHPGSKMPERSFMRSSLKDRAEPIKEALTDAVEKALTK